MLKKMILFFLFFSVNVELANSPIELIKQLINIKQKFDDTAANQMYDLLKQRSALRNQLLRVYEKLPDKNVAPPEKETLSLRYVIGSTLLGGITATPALTINYINKYAMPEKYQYYIDKISLGVAGFIGAKTAFKISKQGAKSAYDFFRYESIRKEINDLENKLNNATESINKLKKNHSYLNNNAQEIDKYEKIYKAFIEFYQKNNHIISKDKIQNFIATHSGTLFPEDATLYDNTHFIIQALKNMKNDLILSIANNPANYYSSSWSNDPEFLVILRVMDQLGGSFLLTILTQLTEAVNDLVKPLKEKVIQKSPYEEYIQLNEWEDERYKQIDVTNAIIKKLTVLAPEKE